MKILVSACLLGQNCKCNGGNNLSEAVVSYVKGHEVIEICPEMLAGLGCPRPPVELVNGIIMTKEGINLDDKFHEGVRLAMEMIEAKEVDLAILQSRSPTCGVKQIYDGSFSGNLIKGQGIFAKELIAQGIKTIDSEDIS